MGILIGRSSGNLVSLFLEAEAAARRSSQHVLVEPYNRGSARQLDLAEAATKLAVVLADSGCDTGDPGLPWLGGVGWPGSFGWLTLPGSAGLGWAG